MRRGLLCFRYNLQRLRDSVQGQASLDKTPSGSSPFVGSQTTSTDRDSDSPFQTRRRDSDQHVVSRLLQSSILSTEEERQDETCNRPKCSQQVRPPRKVQDGVTEIDNQCSFPRRIRSFPGFERCIFPHSSESEIQKVPEICVRGKSVPVHMSSVRTQFQPSSVYCGDGQGDDSSPHDDRNLRIRLPRRHTTEGQITGEFDECSSIPSQTNTFTRIPSKYGQIAADSSHRLRSYRSQIQNYGELSLSPRYKNSKGSEVCTKLCSKLSSVSPDLSVFARKPECSSRSNSARQTPCSPASVRIGYTMETQSGFSPIYNKSNTTNASSLCPLVRTCSVPTRGSVVSPACSNNSTDRCQQDGLGGPSSTYEPQSARRVVSTSVSTSHKCVRDEGSQVSVSELLASSERSYGSSKNRQFDSSFFYSSSGRNQVSDSDRGSDKAPSMVSEIPYQSFGVTHRGKAKRNFRYPLTQRSDSDHRVVPTPSGVCSDLYPMGISSSGPFCDVTQSQTSTVCVSMPRPSSMGSGRFDTILGRDGGVRLPPLSINSQDFEQNKGIQVQDTASGSFLARQILDDGSLGPFVRLPKSSPVVAKTAQTTRNKQVPSEPSSSEPSRLAVIRHAISQRNFSTDVSERIANPRRKSSTRCYDAKWQVFSKWCSEKGLVPAEASIQAIADFLLHLFKDKSLQPSTIKGYRSAISDTLSHFGRNIGHDKYLSSLIQSFDRDRPRPRSLAPKWNLAWVLHVLSGPPFEPLHIIDFKLLSYKTAFLLAFASARRVSELHALSVAPACCRLDKNKATLLTEPGFLAKNETVSYRPAPIVIRRLTHFANDEQSRCLCPRRALGIYISRTKEKRGARLRLFLPISDKHQDISVRSVARWITMAIKIAYEKLTDRDLSFMKIRAHEVRAISSSWAHFNNCPLTDIMHAAFWRSETTFSSFYLRSLQEQADDIYQIGPVVAAQAVVAPSVKSE